MNNDLDRRLLLGAAGLAGVVALAGRSKAGPLNPPAGAVAPTGKTLTDVEPRTLLSAATTPGDADSTFRIATPGSYYLTANLAIAAGKNGIKIAASGVTIDLSGFSITGAGGLDGIVSTGNTIEGVTVRNGRITGCVTGVDLLLNAGAALHNLRIERNTDRGASLGASATVTDSMFLNNGGHGLYCREGALVSRCNAAGNGQSGITVTSGTPAANATIVDCSASGNGFIGISARGVISRCTAFENAETGISGTDGSIITDCSSSDNDGSGFSIRYGQISNSTAAGNALAGFAIYFFSHASNCVAHDNGIGSTSEYAAGFMLTGRFARIEDCHSSDNLFGFRTLDSNGDSNFFARNTATNNTTNWSIFAGNICYVIVGANAAAISGDSGGISPGSTNPNANYTIT